MNLAEGYEDARSAIVLNDLSGCAAVCGVERYREIYIPDHVRRIVIYLQHGKAAAEGIERGRENLTRNGRSVVIVPLPPLRLERRLDGEAGCPRLRARALLGGFAILVAVMLWHRPSADHRAPRPNDPTGCAATGATQFCDAVAGFSKSLRSPILPFNRASILPPPKSPAPSIRPSIRPISTPRFAGPDMRKRRGLPIRSPGR
jgi:hypothetical protein